MYGHLTRALGLAFMIALAVFRGAHSQASPLTLKEATALSDKQIVDRVFSQLGDRIVYVRRPSEYMSPLSMMRPWFSSVGFMLRPHAAEGYSGLCQAEFLNITFRDPNPAPPPSNQLVPPMPPVDPPVVVDDVEKSSLYRKVGDIAPLHGMTINRSTQDICAHIKQPTNFISAPSADAVWYATWLLNVAAAQVKANAVTFQMDCHGFEDKCPALLPTLASKRMTLVAPPCDNIDKTRVQVPEMSYCASFSLSDLPEDARGGQFWRVDIIASITGDGSGGMKASIQRVIISPMMFADD